MRASNFRSSTILAGLAAFCLGAPAVAQQPAPTAEPPAPAETEVPEEHGATPSRVSEQLAGQDPKAARVTITGNIVEPAAMEPDVGSLTVPEGFSISVFAEDLGNARMIAVADNGTIYVTRRKEGDVVMLKDEDGNGEADAAPQVVAEHDYMHGIALDGDTAYLVAVNELFRAPIAEDGTFGDLEIVAESLPDGGQHPNKTLALGPDGMLYLSAGSTCNACAEPNEESATMLRMGKEPGTGRTIFAKGLRNTIGFAFHPETGELWGFDHGIDWLGDDAQPEELNLIQETKMYGWPYVWGDGQANPQDYPEDGTMEEWAAGSLEPVLMYTPHAAPMQMAFNSGTGFPEDYSGDAFVAMRGSWNRNPPSGYEVVRIRFEEGKPQAIEPFVTGFLVQDGEEFRQMGRLAGLAFMPDGSMLFSDDENGVLYRVTAEEQ